MYAVGEESLEQPTVLLLHHPGTVSRSAMPPSKIDRTFRLYPALPQRPSMLAMPKDDFQNRAKQNQPHSGEIGKPG